MARDKQAFPVASPIGDLGMTLLDYFAGQALIGIAVAWTKYPDDQLIDGYCQRAYKFAEAMLKEKEKLNNGQ